MSKLKKANFFVKTLRNIDPASSTFTFETQAVVHPAGDVITVFGSVGKCDSKNRGWRGCWDKNRLKRAKISFIQFYLEYPLSPKLCL